MNESNQKSPIYLLLRGSHRSVGVFLIVFVLLLAGTGILLNHTGDLGLSERYAPAFIAARYYPMGEQQNGITGYMFQDSYYYTLDGQLFKDGQVVGRCGQLQGVGLVDELLVLLCDGELLLLTQDHQLVERLGGATGVPAGLERMMNLNGQLIVASDSDIYQFDLDNLTASLVGQPVTVWPVLEDIPARLVLSHSISWQQFILDIHSGIFLGSMGKWFSDLVAVCLSGMAVSGFAMWLRR